MVRTEMARYIVCLWIGLGLFLLLSLITTFNVIPNNWIPLAPTKGISGTESTATPQDPHTGSLPSTGICSSAERQRYIQAVCQANGWITQNWTIGQFLENVIVDDKHKLMYCILPKAGSISFRTLLRQLATQDESFNESMVIPKFFRNYTGFRMVNQLTEEELQNINSNYKKLVVVRHPLDRLRAVYDDKLARPGVLNEAALTRNIKIINTYLKAKGLYKNSSFDPSREILEFNQYIELLATDVDNKFYDPHWITFEERCKPCQVNYDFILRLETLDEDSSDLFRYLRSFGGSVIPNLPHSNQHSAMPPQDKLNKLERYYETISPDIIRRVLTTYNKDLQLFGYGYNTSSGGATCWEQMSTGQYCC